MFRLSKPPVSIFSFSSFSAVTEELRLLEIWDSPVFRFDVPVLNSDEADSRLFAPVLIFSELEVSVFAPSFALFTPDV